MKPGEKLCQHLPEVRRLAASYHIRDLRVFGSVARNEDTEASDIDLLAFYTEEATIFDHAVFSCAVKRLLDVNCDILSDEILDKAGFEHMMRQSITLDEFEAGQYTTRGMVAREERKSSGDDNLRWVLRRIADTIGDLSFDEFQAEPAYYDALAYQFQLLASIAGNSSPEQLTAVSARYGVDFSGCSMMPELLMTTVYPEMLYRTARRIRQSTEGCR